MKDDHGFTLIELIIVMVIMGIVVIGSMTGYNMLGSADARNAARRINTMLSLVQMENMTKNEEYYLLINEDVNGDYYLNVKTVSGTGTQSQEKLDLKNGEIIFQNSGDTTEYLLSYSAPAGGRAWSNEMLEVCFRKDTGVYKNNSFGMIVSNIKVSAAGRTYSIKLVTATGKHYIE